MRNHAFLLKVLALALLLMCLLSACGGEPEPTTEPVVYYKATFLMNGVVYGEQQVEEGQCPVSVSVSIPGLRFAYWSDESGNQVDPTNLPLEADATYVAVVHPELAEHASFLFPDESGLLQPYAALTAQDLHRALDALATDEAKLYFPSLPESGDISSVQLQVVLGRFFPEAKVEEALRKCSETVTRAQFAAAMCQLLERGIAEKIVLPADSVAPGDVNANIDNFQYLLEAAMDHTHDAAGISWENVELPSGLEPGFVNLEGYLYYVQDNGFFLRDADLGRLHFGPDGRYTSGDAELDKMVAEVLAPIVMTNASAERIDILRKGFEYCRDAFTYLRKDPYNVGDIGWEIEDAKEMFGTGLGNCYNYAAAFWAVARGLGYEARAISGTCTDTDQPHGWVIIEFDGADYFFDCEWEMAYHERGVYDKDMFMIPLDKVWWWGYEWVKGQ